MNQILLFGGTNRERLVSTASGQNLARLLPEASCWFWGSDGRVHVLQRELLLAHQDVFRAELRPGDQREQFESLPAALDSLDQARDVIFLGLHGGAGEDGTVQRWLEERSLSFTGSGSEASALAFDKNRAKERIREHGLSTAESRIFSADSAESHRHWIEEQMQSHGKVVLKPAREGSSYGLHFIETAADLDGALQEITETEYEGGWLAEPFLKGVELTIGVIDDGQKVIPLPSVEIRPVSGRSFDYAGKYLGEGVQEICPGEVSEEIEQQARALGLAAHKALGCFGYSRTDIIAGESGVWFLETNTLPGLTRSSLLPQELTAAGIAFEHFLHTQIELAVGRARVPA